MTEIAPAQESEKEAATAPVENTEEVSNLITFDDFIKVDLRVAQILKAEKIEKSEKLVRLQLDVGPELGKRQILAGIAKHYSAEELEGKKIAIVTNLKPRKMMGEMSEGMLLAASDDQGNLELVNPGNSIAAGSRIG